MGEEFPQRYSNQAKEPGVPLRLTPYKGQGMGKPDELAPRRKPPRQDTTIEDQLMTDDKGPVPPRVRASRGKAKL